MNKWIYYFGTDRENTMSSPASANTLPNTDPKSILGGKGSGLAEMSKLGLPIPPGFTISTEICNYYYQNNNSLPANFSATLATAIQNLEKTTGKIFGSKENPLLVSVRSGSKISMPGMMDTVLNLGINDEIVESLSIATGNRNFAFDSYKRFLAMYGGVVLNIPSCLFEDIEDNESSLERTITEFKKIIEKHHTNVPTCPYTQLESAIIAVIKSWMSERAVIYRRLNNIPEDLGTAVNIQSMVFGNMGDSSATGVVFTRSPSTGEKKIFGEFLVNAQGEDIVSGTRTPMPICYESEDANSAQSMQMLMPKIFNELQATCTKLELHYRDIQDIEFTIENGKLYILQTRDAKRTARSAIKVATDMAKEGLVSKEEAIMRIDVETLNQLLHTAIDYSKNLSAIAHGLPASPGAATGIAVFSPYDAEAMSHHHKVILVRNDTSPEDIQGMHVASGILTSRGGMTSHAAVVARGMGKPCVCGASGITVDEKNKLFKVGNIIVKNGDTITIDGGTGKIFLGQAPLIQPSFSEEFETILSWADSIRKLRIRANAETALDTKTALKFGAEGIGLCRTEHMFFDNKKIPLVREMIIAPSAEKRQQAINNLLPLQIHDFKELFRTMRGLPINIRLLDPPLHEFLPQQDSDKEALAKSLGLPILIINQRLHALHEVNPMLGHRGCRLGISCPEIYQMQVEAIFIAIRDIKLEEGIDTNLELMIPLISNVNELKKLKFHIAQIVGDIEKNHFFKPEFTLGTMIELPRAALLAETIAPEVGYFSFGTNDLTQTTYGISRDDTASFLPDYLEQKIFPNDPFIRLDEEGVGQLIEIAVKRGKGVNSTLKLGVCGEHAGNPESIEFFHKIGIDYISCSPYRIPIARIAAAQATIKYGLPKL